jgi:hypothetical protein
VRTGPSVSTRVACGEPVRAQGGEGDRAEPRASGRELARDRGPVPRDDDAQRPRVEDHVPASALPRDARRRDGARGTPVAQRVRGARPGRHVGEEVAEEPADRAVGPAFEDGRLQRRGPARRSREPQRVGATDAARGKRHAGARGERAPGDAGALHDVERHRERRGSGGPGEQRERGQSGERADDDVRS